MKKDKKTIRKLAEKLKEIRKRPVPQAQVDEFNNIVIEDERPADKSERKIARPPETSV